MFEFPHLKFTSCNNLGTETSNPYSTIGNQGIHEGPFYRADGSTTSNFNNPAFGYVLIR
jgi:hypothetical protein